VLWCFLFFFGDVLSLSGPLCSFELPVSDRENRSHIVFESFSDFSTVVGVWCCVSLFSLFEAESLLIVNFVEYEKECFHFSFEVDAEIVGVLVELAGEVRVWLFLYDAHRDPAIKDLVIDVGLCADGLDCGGGGSSCCDTGDKWGGLWSGGSLCFLSCTGLFVRGVGDGGHESINDLL